MIRLLLFFLAVGFLASVPAAAQQKAISRSEYFAAFTKAADAAESTFPKRVTITISKSRPDAVAERTRQVQEYPVDGQYRYYIEKYEREKGRTINDFRKIGGMYYCKRGKLPWKKSSSSCEPDSLSMSPPPDKEEYSSAAEVTGMSFRMYRSHRYPKSAEGVDFFSEQVITINARGLLEKVEIKSGKVGSQPTTHQLETYEYDVVLPKVTAPIK
jgi:hypothetical protein